MFKIKRNKLNRQEAFNFEKRSRFGIRKLTIGVVSLAIGSGMVLNAAEQVQAGTDYDPGVEIRYVRNGSPKDLASDGDFKIEKSFVEVNGVQYVDVTLTFNQDHDGYARRFLYFNMPKSLYEPEKITRELYWQGERTPRETTEYRTWQGDYRFADEPWYRLWDHRYIIGSPDSLQGERHKKVTSPTDPGGDTIGGQSEGRWNGDWDRLMFSVPNNAGSGKEALTKAASDFKATSRTVYINRFSGSTDKHVYKFRARVKDGNAPMNFVVGLNEESGSHANFLAQYGTTPDTRTLAEKSTINPPARIGVNSLQDLSQQTRNNIAQKIREANPDLFNGAGPLVTNVTVSSDGIGGNAVLRFKDGSEKTIPMKQLVYKINTASGAAPTAPSTSTNFVLKGRGVVGNDMVGLQGEDHQLNLPAKKAVANIATIGNKATYLTQWQEQLNKFLELNKQLQSWNNQWGFKNGARTFGPDNWKAQHLTASIKYTDSRQTQIQGIEVKGVTKDSRFGGPVNTQVYGLLTPAMLFYQEDPLKTTKDEAKATIDSIGNINGKGADWKSRIDAAQNQQAIEAIITEARNEKNALDKKKAAAIQEINALPHLSQNEKTAVINAINSATTTTVVDQKLNDAKALNTTNMRNKGKEAINALSKLNDGEKTPYRNRIDNATTQDQINAIIEEAAFEDLKRSALEQLDNMNPAPSNKDELRAQITETNFNTVSSDGKKPAERIEAILERAKAEVLRDQARRDINAISGLPEEKKNEFLGIVDRAQTPSEITNAVDQARAYSDYIQAKDAINQLTNINNKQKEELLAGLERDKSQQGVADMLTSARALDGEMKHLKDLVAQAETIKQSSDYSRADRAKQNTFNTALDAAKRVSPQTGELPTTSVGQLISNLTDAIRGLGGTTQPVTKDVDKGNLRAEIDRSSQVKDPANAEYTYASEDKKQAYEQALTQAIAVRDKANPVATQAEVDAALAKLQEARIALDGHAPDRDTTPPVLGGDRMEIYSDVAAHAISTVGRKVPRPNQPTPVEEYGENSTRLNELIVTDQESGINIDSVTFDEATQRHLQLLGLKFVKYDRQQDNGAVGYFTTIEENGVVNFTGTGIAKFYFTVANTHGVVSPRLEYRYILKDDIAPTATPTEHVLIRGQEATITIPIQDNSMFGTEGGVSTGTMSIRPENNTSDPLTPAILNFTNGNTPQAFTISIPDSSPEFVFENHNYGKRSRTGTVSLTANPSQTLERTTYKFRVADGNTPRGTSEKVTFTDITFTVVDRLAAPEESAKVSVNNPSRLTEDEKNAIKQAVRTANPHIAEIDNAANGDTNKQVRIDVAENGRVTVTYPHGGKTDTLTAQQVSKTNPAPTFGDFGVNTTVGSSTYKTIFVFGAKTNGSEVVEYAPDFVPDNATGGIPVQDNTGIAKVELIGIDNENKVTDTGIAFTREGKLVADFDTTQRTNLVRNGINSVWHHRIKATDNGNPAKSAITSTIRIKAYRVEKTDETAIAKVYGTALTQDELTNKLRVAVSSGMTVPADNHSHKVAGYTPENGQFTAITNISELPTSGNYTVKMETTNVYGQTIVNNIAVDYNEQKDVIEPIAPTQQVLIDGAAPTTDADKTALINALKEANKTPEGASKFPENTRFDVAENGAVTITYPDNSSETVTVPFKQKDSAQHTPVVAETPIDSATTAGTPLTETERNAVKAAVTVPTYSGSGQPTVTVPADARVTNGTNGNTGKPVVVATVEYPDGSSETVEVPVRQRDTLADSTDLVVPEAVQIKGTTVAEDEKQTIIDALKAANPGKLPDDPSSYSVAPNGTVTVTYSDNSSEPIDVPLKSGIPTVTAQPHDIVVFKNTDMTTPVELAGFTDNESIKDIQIVGTDGSSLDQMGLTVDEKAKENNVKSALISGKTNSAVGKHTRKLRALDNLDQASAATNDFSVRIVDATVNQPETAITKEFGQALTPEEVRSTINFNVGSGQNNLIDFDVVIPADAPTSGKNVEVPVIIRTKAHASASEEFKRTFVSQDKTVTVRATWPTQADNIEVTAPADTTPVLIDGARPTSEADKTALIDALKEANKTPEGTSKFPENTRFDVAENGAVTITYPDRSSETVTVPFKQKDSAQHTPTVAETPINSAATAGTPLTEDERNAVKAAVTVPNFPGDRQPTVTVPENARVTNGTEGNTGKPVVVATVEYPDGSSETVEVPVKQRDNAKYEATISNPETPAAIKASHASDTAITDEADKNAILAKVSVPEGSSGRPSLDQNPVVEERDGKQVVKVTVTYPDQTTDTVYVPVDQKDNETHNPTAPAESVKLDAPATANSTLSDDDKAAVKAAVTVPDGSRGEVSLPEGAKVELVGDKPVVKATVTYPDGTTDIVDVPVVQKDSTKYDATASTTPVPLDSPVTPGQTLSAEEREALKFGVNVPAGSNGQIHVPENAAVKLDGDKPVVEAEVRYPDGTVDKVQVPVRQYDRAVYTPNLVNPKEVPISVEPTNDTQITSPDDAAILANVDVPAATPDGTKPEVTKTIASPVKDGTGTNQGKKVVEVEITYPDKSKEKIEVPVKHADNQVHNPEAPTKPVQLDVAATTDTSLSDADKQAVKDAVTIPQGSGGVASLPEDAKVVDRNGTPVVPVTVTYPDGTTETVDVPVVQKDSTKHTPVLTEANSPVLTDTPAKANEPVQETDKAAIAAKVDKTNLPQGTETKVPDDAVVELENGKPVVPVLVSYPDGTSETIKVPVDQKDDLTYNPVAPNKDNAVAITSPQTPGTEITDPTDKAAILDSVTVPAVDGGQAPKVTKEITSPVTEGPDGPYVTVKVSYPDGTSETVNVPVNQKDNETHNPTAPAESVKLDAPAVQDGTLSERDKQAVKDAVVIPEGSGGQASLPADAKVIDRNGTPVVPVTVTYPDNTTDTVYVPVVQKDSVKHTPSLTDADQPVLTDTPAKAETPVQDTDKAAIAAKVDLSKLPENTTAKVPDGAKVELDGDKPVVPVLVSYPDGTSEIIKVPVDQKDSETYTPTAPAAEAPVAITGSDAPDAPIAEADKPAILNSVTVPAVDGGQAPKVTKEITSPVKVVDGKAFVEVTVTYPDKTSEVIPVPVNQKDNEANTPTVTAPEKPAPISVPVAENTPVETDADKKLITDKVNVAGLPNPPQSVKVAEPAKVVMDQAGNPVVNVEVTYPDGTKDIVPVPVKQADNQTNTPSLKEPELGKPAEVLVAIDPTPGVAINNPMDKEAIAAKVDLSKLPAGTTAEVADGAVVANDPLTNKPVVPVTVTYPDGTSETINVPVKQADNLAMDPSLKDTNPVPILTEATVGLTVSDKANLDAIVAKVDPKTGKAEVVNNTIVAGKEDGPHAGQPVVNVLVTYPDGTQDTIEVPVKQADNVANEPSLTDQTPVPIQAAATTGTLVPADDKPAILAKVNLPAGAEATIADDATVVREDGQAVVPVTVTYPDGTTDTISVPVKRADNSKYTPSQVTDTVQVDAATAPGTAITSQDDKDAIIAAVTVPKVAAGEKAPVVSLPENPQVEVVNAQPVVKAIVTYADGTTDTVDVPIVQKVSATKEPSLKEAEAGKPAQAVITENPTAGASITDPADQNVILDKVVVPEGGKASIADDAVVEMDGDQPVLPVTVTYTDGSKDIIKVPVKQADNVAKEPSLKSQTPVGVMDAPAVGAQVEEPADLEAIKNNVDTKGGTASIEDPTIVEGPNNQPAVAVKVTYPDGTADTILVPIKTADNVTYTPVLKSTDPVLVSVATDNGTAVPEADQAKILANVDVPALTADGDKPAVDLSIENPVVLQKNGQAGVEVTVTYPDGSKDKIFVPVDTDTDKDGFSNKEEEKAGTSATDPASTPDGQDSAERLNPGLTEPVEVKNPDKLTDAEKEAVKKAVEASNDLPAGTTVSVANDGTVTVTYPDNSTDTIQPKDAVTQFVDTDGDGISDRQETENGTDPSKVDSDNDGFSDKEEVERGTDPTKADSKPASSETDTDGDGISNEDEATRGTDPNKSDTDGDGFSDQEEITAGSNPTKADSTPANVDKDGDGFTDTEEAAAGTDANNPSSTPEGQDSAERLNPGLTEPVEVKNSDKLTDAEKEAVKKAVEDSNDLPAGTTVSVANDGTVTVTYPDKSTDTIQPAETVKVAKDTDKDGFTDTEEATAGTSATDPSSTPAGQDSADRLNPGLTEPVEVKNPDKLTDAEKESVKRAVEETNDLPAGTEVSVSDSGTVTVTYPDKSTDTIQPAETVKVAKDTDKDGFTDTEEATAGTSATDPSSTPAGQDSAGQLTPSLAEPVEVKNPDKLTDAEKESVKKAVEDSNDLPEGTEVSVSDNGTVTVTYPDKSTDTIQPAETVKVAKDTDKDGFTDTEEEKAGTNATDPSSTPAGQDSAGQLTPGLTEPVEVKNPDKLTDAEKDAVKKAVEDSNDLPEGTEVTVSDNGTVTVTYPDKSADTIQPTDTVKAAKPVSETPVAPSKPEVTATDSGAVVVTPPTDNVTNLDITFTPEGASQPVTVVVSKDENGIWTAPADSGLVINSDGTITIPAEKVADGTAVTVVAENGSISSPEVGSTVVPVPAVTPETPVAPSKPEVTATDSGAVVVTPPTDNVTNLDITFTPEGSSQPVTVVVSKDATGTWTAPADSGLVVNPDGTITIPAENVADGTAVTVVAENGSVSSPEVGSAVVPVPTPELPAIPAKPTSVTNADGSVTIVPPVENVTGLDITFTPEGATEPVTVTLGKDATGAWTAPADSGLVVNPDGTITIPADRLADGTEGQVGLVAKNGDLTSNDPAPQVPETPAKSSVETNENGSVTIVPPVENVTGIDITFTPEGASQPVTVVVSKDATGAWTAPADSGLVVNPDGTITIPADKVADGTAVSVVTKNGQVPSDEASATYVPAKPASTDTPVVEVPATPSLALDGSGNVLITPPAENATSLDITFTPAGSETPITVTANKDATGNWILPETSIAVVNPDGTISISTSEMEGGTAVSVVAKNEGVPSSQAATLLVQPKQTAEELAPTVKKPIAVEDASKLTDAEKKELEDVVRKDNVLPEGTEVSVADDGTVTVTYPDKSTDTILPTKTVMDAQNGKGTSHSLPAYDLTADEDKDGFTNEEELKQGSNVADAKSVPAGKSSAERLTPTNDLAVKVKDLTKLSDAEKKAVETAIRKDKDLPEGTQIEVANDGSVTITYPDGSIGRLPADQTVLHATHGEGVSHSLPAYDLTADEDKDGFTNEEELKQGSNVADAKSVPAGKSSAERLTPTNDLAVKVKDLTKLTDAEKKAVETAIRKNNILPEGTQIEVANDGSVTITYPDGSVDQIVATKVVATDSTVNPDSGVSQSSGTTKVLPGSASSTRAAKKPLPATGENGSPILVLSGLALLAGVAMFRKAKREDEN
ncbi:Rib/alpha-like domain-containing protein [Streptococcus suis]|uniref:Rib/alpha-like domain-containing protein n=1 Tax=Streptococcus suis TaxID=1307 RepID=UPI0037BD6831